MTEDNDVAMRMESLVEDESKKKYFETANVIKDNICNSCNGAVDVQTQSVCCMFCKFLFHATDCFRDKERDISAPTILKSTIIPAVDNSGAWEKRYGRFQFVCEYCMTMFEQKSQTTSDNRVDILDRRVDNLGNDVSEIKRMLVSITTSNSGVMTPPPVQNMANVGNVWEDKERTRQLLIIKKDNEGNTMNIDVLQKTCTDYGIQVTKTFETSKDERAVVLPSKESAKALVEKLKEKVPQHSVDRVPTRLPTINLVGIPLISKEELREQIMKLNERVRMIWESSDDTTFDIMAIIELKNRPGMYRASIRVSELIRQVIYKSGDRLFIGALRSCKVHSVFFIRNGLEIYHKRFLFFPKIYHNRFLIRFLFFNLWTA